MDSCKVPQLVGEINFTEERHHRERFSCSWRFLGIWAAQKEKLDHLVIPSLSFSIFCFRLGKILVGSLTLLSISYDPPDYNIVPSLFWLWGMKRSFAILFGNDCFGSEQLTNKSTKSAPNSGGIAAGGFDPLILCRHVSL